MRFKLRSLFALTSVCAVFVAVGQSAGYLTATGIAIVLCFLSWAAFCRKRGRYLFPRLAVGIFSLAALWHLSVDWSWFEWFCADCYSAKDIVQYRVMGFPITNDVYEEESFFNIALKDLDVPCPHANTSYFHKHRFWGLLQCAYPCWNCYTGIYGPHERYTETIATRVRERGRADPEFAREVYLQIVEKHNFAFFWDALMADEMVQDSINAQTAEEALSWLKGAETYTPRIFESNTIRNRKELIAFVEDIYRVGASQVLAIGIQEYDAIKRGDEFVKPSGEYFDTVALNPCDYEGLDAIPIQEAELMAIKLPTQIDERSSVFKWEAEYQNAWSWYPTPDYGQSYILIWVN